MRGLDAGADDYLVKPFSLLELAARLRALARRDDRARPGRPASHHRLPADGQARTGRALPARGGPSNAPALPGEYLVQAIDASRRVRGSSDAGATSLLTSGQLTQARHSEIWVTTTADEEDARVTAGPLPGHPGWVAVVAVSLETYDATQSQVQRGLAIGGGAFVAIAGLGAYWLPRAALSPG